MLSFKSKNGMAGGCGVSDFIFGEITIQRKKAGSPESLQLIIFKMSDSIKNRRPDFNITKDPLITWGISPQRAKDTCGMIHMNVQPP